MDSADEIRLGSIPEQPAGYSDSTSGGSRRQPKRAKPAHEADSFEPSSEPGFEEQLEDCYEPSQSEQDQKG